ncbi:tetratricopeptide repeat protein [candidate division WWE3 bacterium]|nr:tetratricopeptide repeat protein [candidate division WWE3 bacterium]
MKAGITLLLFAAAVGLAGYHAYKRLNLPKNLLAQTSLSEIINKKSNINVEKRVSDIAKIKKGVEGRVKGTADTYKDIGDIAASQSKNLASYVYENTKSFVDPKKKPDSKILKDAGEANMEKKEYEKAIENFEKYVTEEPQSISGYCSLGGAYYETGDKERAVEALRKAFEILSK